MSENFNLIWGSNASQTTVWNDSDYQRGWETIGDTPPTAQQFDALQRRNDLKAQALNNTIAPIAEANDANNRKPQTVYNVGDMQYDSQLPTGWYLLCTVGGTSGDGDITFPSPLTEDASVMDGTVVWRLHKLSTSVANIDSLEKSLAESTGYGIVSGCAPSIGGLTVTVGAGIVHLADGTRKEIAQTNITLDAADPTNPRIDLVYIDSTGAVAKITGTAAASPSAPALPTGGISVCNVSVTASATTGTVTDIRRVLARWYNTGIVNVKDFGAVGDGVTDDTTAFKAALLAAKAGKLFVPKGNYNITENLFADGVKEVVDNGTYNNVKPIYPTKPNLFKSIKQLSLEQEMTVDSDKNVEGICYNSKTKRLITAVKNGDDTAQILYVINPETYAVDNSYSYTELGHCNSLTYCEKTNKIYAVKNASNIAVINADTMAYETTITLTKLVFCLKYDADSNIFIGYCQSTDSTVLYIRHFDVNLTFVKEYSKDIMSFGTMNGMLVYNQTVLMGAYNYYIQCDYFADNFEIIESRSSYEVEDFCYCTENNKFYATYIPSTKAGIYTLASFKKNKINYRGFFAESGKYIKDKNLNDIIEPGVYNVHAVNKTANELNFPNEEQRGTIYVSREDSVPNVGSGTQLFIRFSTSDLITLYARRRVGAPNKGGTWGKWYRLDARGRRLKANVKIPISMEGGQSSYTYNVLKDGVFEFRGKTTGYLQVYVRDVANEFILPAGGGMKAASIYVSAGDVVRIMSDSNISEIMCRITELQYEI